MKCWKPFVLLGAAICGIVLLTQTIQNASAGQQTARRNFLQSTFGVKGNFEVYVPQGDVITHYWRDNDNILFPWNVGTDKIFYPCPDIKCAKPRSITLIQSNFIGGSGKGNFEAIVRVAQLNVPDRLDFWYLDTGSWQWQGPFPLSADGEAVTGVTGDPVLIQARGVSKATSSSLFPRATR